MGHSNSCIEHVWQKPLEEQKKTVQLSVAILIPRYPYSGWEYLPVIAGQKPDRSFLIEAKRARVFPYAQFSQLIEINMSRKYNLILVVERCVVIELLVLPICRRILKRNIAKVEETLLK